MKARPAPDLCPGQRCRLAASTHRIAQMEHPVALGDHLGILEHQVAVGERPEVRLPPAEDDRHDVDRHVVDEPQRQRLPTDLTRAHTNLPLASQLLCSRDPLLHRGVKWYDASGCQPAGRGRCDTTTTWSLAGGWPSQPLVRSNRCRPMTRTFWRDHMPRT